MVTTANPETFLTGATVVAATYKCVANVWSSLSIAAGVVEIAGTGIYTLLLTAAELNYDYVCIKFTTAAGADSFVLFRMKDYDNGDVITGIAGISIVSPGSLGENVI
jgi:hypothetical protein